MAAIRNKVFVITGSARGLGRAFAEAVLKEGGRVAISDILLEEGDETVKALGESYGHGNVHFVLADVTKEEDWEQLWTESEAFFKAPVDVLVNNAGINYLPGWKKCMDINIDAVMTGTYLAFDKMGRSKGSGRGGLIVNMASMAGILTKSSFEATPYHVSKTAVVSLTKALGTDRVFRKENVKVLCICPFFADTKIIPDKNVISKKFRTGIMTPEKVANDFITLVTDGRNGAVMSVMPDAPPIYYPAFEYLQLGFLYFTAMGLEKAVGIKSLKPWQQSVALVLTLYIVYYLLRFVVYLLYMLF